jgi:pimeloyl-ACP methyl ester carboxylesterase
MVGSREDLFMKWLRRVVVAVLVVVVIAYGAAAAGMYFLQRNFQYEPNATKFLDLSESKLTAAELVTIPTSENQTVRGWYQAPQAGRPLIVFYKGNWGSFTDEHERFETWVADGFGFLAFDYRGFPASPGEISEDNMLKDAIAAFAWAENKGFPVVIWGRSIGTGPATYVASERNAEALLLETPFDSALSVGQERYWFLPVAWLMKDQFRVDLWIPKVEEPVFVALGTADTTIPYAHGQRAYDLAPNQAGLWIEEGAGHSDLWKAGIWAKAKPFFEAAVAAQ